MLELRFGVVNLAELGSPREADFEGPDFPLLGECLARANPPARMRGGVWEQTGIGGGLQKIRVFADLGWYRGGEVLAQEASRLPDDVYCRAVFADLGNAFHVFA
jgi:hypothetical protein